VRLCVRDAEADRMRDDEDFTITAPVHGPCSRSLVNYARWRGRHGPSSRPLVKAPCHGPCSRSQFPVPGQLRTPHGLVVGQQCHAAAVDRRAAGLAASAVTVHDIMVHEDRKPGGKSIFNGPGWVGRRDAASNFCGPPAGFAGRHGSRGDALARIMSRMRAAHDLKGKLCPTHDSDRTIRAAHDSDRMLLPGF
jgi:hypothetical protein